MLDHLHWQGDRHCVAEPTPRERRLRRLLRIAGRVHAKAAAGLDRVNEDGRQIGMGEW